MYRMYFTAIPRMRLSNTGDHDMYERQDILQFHNKPYWWNNIEAVKQQSSQGNYPKHLFLHCNLLIQKGFFLLHISANRTSQPIYSIQNSCKNVMKPQELKWDYVNRSSWDHQCPLLDAFALKKSSLGDHSQSKTNRTKDRRQQMSPS